MNNLDRSILKIHNYMYANDGLSNTEALTEFLKIFYCKILDEKNENLLSKTYKNEQDIINIINFLFNKIKKKLNTIFDTNENINLKNSTLFFVVNELKGINFTNIESDIKGHILQKIIDRSYRESRGQFFTPNAVVNLMVKIIDPQINEKGCDPACGTGGFLFAALNHMAQKNTIKENDIKNLYFFDISKTLIKLIVMRMMFEYSVSNFNFSIQDSIETFTTENYYDYIITNPPFGSQGKINNTKILSKYDLALDEKKQKLKTQVPDILFVEKIIRLLKENGRAGIILPDGDFENPTLKYFRKYLIENIKIDAIISLPDGTFIPYGTGIKSSILFFHKVNHKKLQEDIKNNYRIFYGKITKLGYSFSKHSKNLYDKNGLIDEDYTEVISSYLNKMTHKSCYSIDINEIIKNDYILSENFYSPLYKQEIEQIKKGKYVKLKDIAEIKYNKEKIIKENTYKYIEIGDISAYTSEIINCDKMYGEDLPSRASYIVNEGDIIVATAGNAIGTSKHAKAIVTKNYDKCICTNGFSVIKPIKTSPYFLIHFFNSKAFLTQISKYKYGTAIPCISRENFENILVPIPDKTTITKIENRVKGIPTTRRSTKIT